ncbi:MAG: hypothetical protein PHQ36_03785 [Anaerolineales bacterium]|nr:hypothetical protein [Anaerolineales bacterium]
MLILISSSLLFLAALVLMTLRMSSANARIAWLVAVGGGALALISVFMWLAQMPFEFSLPAWQPRALFVNPILFRADGLSFPFVASISALTLAILLTAVARPTLTNPFAWAGALALGGLGLLAVTANNPFTLLLIWGALDLVELVAQIRSVDGPAQNERVVISFSTRIFGIGLLLWANIVSVANGSAFDFQSISPNAGLYLVAAAGLRLGVLPLHLPYSAESILRRGFGTSFRLISAASSLALLAHVPAGSLASTLTPFMLALAVIAALYGGWMWLRAPDELIGRPYWVIGLAALAVISALSGNPLGAVAWGCALILVGGSLFLSSIQHVWLNRALLLGAWSLSSLPFSLTGGAWLRALGFFAPFVIAAQALLISGFIRHALRPAGRDSLEAQPVWMRTVYLSGIVLLVALQFLLGITGWGGALQVGAWLHALLASLLAAILVWATPRLRILNPIRAHWVGAAASGVNSVYRNFWFVYRALEGISQTIAATLEGESGIMWTLLFMALFILYLTQGLP